MEEPGEQCTVVFASIVTEAASGTYCVCVGGGSGDKATSPPPLAGSVTIYAKNRTQRTQVRAPPLLTMFVTVLFLP